MSEEVDSLSTFTNRLTLVTWTVRLLLCTGCVLAPARFRAEAFDAFNTPQFLNPDSSLKDGSFEQVTSSKSDWTFCGGRRPRKESGVSG